MLNKALTLDLFEEENTISLRDDNIGKYSWFFSISCVSLTGVFRRFIESLRKIKSLNPLNSLETPSLTIVGHNINHKTKIIFRVLLLYLNISIIDQGFFDKPYHHHKDCEQSSLLYKHSRILTNW